MPAGSETQRMVEQSTGLIASLVGAVMQDGYLAAAGRQGVKELATAFGQMWPDSIHVNEPGSIFSPTQGEIAAARHHEPEVPHEMEHGRGL